MSNKLLVKKLKKSRISIRDPRKGYYAELIKVLPEKKTALVLTKKRVWVKKMKAFYINKKLKYSVHYDPLLPKVNPLNVKELQVGSRVYCVPTRRISKTKSSVVFFYDYPKSKGRDTYVKL